MKRLAIGVGIAMSAIAIYAATPGLSPNVSADGPMDGLEQLSGIQIGDLSDLPAEPQPATAPESPAPAAPIEQPALDSNAPASPQPANAAQQPAAPAGDAAPITLPATGAGPGGAGGTLIIAGFAAIFALAGLACLGSARALEAVRSRKR